MDITVTYTVTDYSNGFGQKERTFTVPNYRTLRSLLSAVDAACHEIEELSRQSKADPRKGVEL